MVYYSGGGGTAVTLVQEFIIGRIRRQNARDNAKVEKVITHIDKLGELTQLFRNFATYHRNLLADSEGNLITDEAGQGIIMDSRIMLPAPEWLEEFEKLENKNLASVIFNQKHNLSIETGKINDLLKELDTSGKLSKMMARYRESVFRLESLINKRQDIHDFEGQAKIFILFMRQLDNAEFGRQAVREKVSRHHK